MTIKKIIKTLFTPTTLKLVAFLLIVWIFFVHPVFAQDANTNSELMKSIKEWMRTIIGICSRWWVVLAILAGKLMSNDFVYGSFMHLDIYLRKIRNIMKNFANFALIGIILISIIKSLVGKESLNAKKLILSALWAGILIQASWFLLGALVDISTVATAAISSFPTSFISNNTELKDTITQSISQFKTKRIKYNLEADMTDQSQKIVEFIEPIGINQSQTTQELNNLIMPTYNSISGPFIYLGMGVFGFQHYLEKNNDSWDALTLSFALRLFFILFFTIGLLFLFVANIMRVWLLWVFIIGAPFFVLAVIFKDFFKWWDGGWWWSIGKLFNLWNLLSIVFKPVIFVAWISLMLIIVASIQNTMKNQWVLKNLNGVDVSVTSGQSNLSVPGVTNITVKNSPGLIGDTDINYAKDFFSEVIMYMITIFLMWRMIKLSLTIWSWPIEDKMKKRLTTTESMAKSLPILPIAWWASFNATKGLIDRQRTETLKTFGMDRDGRFSWAEKAFEAQVAGWMWTKMDWTKQDYNELQEDIDNHFWSNFFTLSQQIWQERLWWLSLSNPSRKAMFIEYLKTPDAKSQWFKKIGTSDNTFDNYFKGDDPQYKKNRLLLHSLMWWDVNDNSSSTYIPQWKWYDDLGNTDISYNNLLANRYYTKWVSWEEEPKE